MSGLQTVSWGPIGTQRSVFDYVLTSVSWMNSICRIYLLHQLSKIQNGKSRDFGEYIDMIYTVIKHIKTHLSIRKIQYWALITCYVDQSRFTAQLDFLGSKWVSCRTIKGKLKWQDVRSLYWKGRFDFFLRKRIYFLNPMCHRSVCWYVLICACSCG